MRKRLIRLCTMVMAGVMLAGCGNSGAGEKNGANNEGKQSGGKETYDVYMQTVETDEYEYDEYTNHIELFKYKGEDVEWKVPSQINGKDVTVLGDRGGYPMFEKESEVEKVIIPNTVSDIRKYAFKNCQNVDEIHIPDSVKEIGQFAFQDTKWYENLTDKYVVVGDGVLIKYNGEEKELVIPDGVKCISHFCKAYELDEWARTNVTKITLPEGLEVIKAAFYSTQGISWFSNVEEMNIPDSIKKIEQLPSGRRKMPQYYKAEGVVVGDGVFLGYYPEEDEGTYVNEDGNITYPEGVKYIFMTGDTVESCNSIILPDSYEGNATHAFHTIKEIDNIIVPKGVKILDFDCNVAVYMEMSKHISLPDGLVAIESRCLMPCDLEELTIPASVVSIGRFAVNCNVHLKELTLNEGLLYIGRNAFSQCSALKEVRIPSSVKIIGKRAFDPEVTIRGVAGSEAERFAKENGNVFVAE